MKYSIDDIRYLDDNYKYISLIYDFAFRYVFNKNNDIFIKYFSSILNIDIDNIILLDDYKFILNNCYILYININKNILLNIDDLYNEKIYIISLYDIGKKNIDIVIENKKCSIIFKYIDLNDNSYSDIFLRGLFFSNSYRELYNIMSNILSIDELDNIINSIKDMSLDKDVLYELSFIKMKNLIYERMDKKKKSVVDDEFF